MKVSEFVNKYHSDINYREELISKINKNEHKYVIEKEDIDLISKMEYSLLRKSLNEDMQPSYKEINNEISSLL